MYIQDIAIVINYIEEHLCDALSLDQVAQIIYISPYHLHRVFHAMTGITIGEYIRKRRLSEAAVQLQNNDKTILEIALEHQFTSQEAFTRSFKQTFDVTPANYRKTWKSQNDLLLKPITVKDLTYILNNKKMEEPKIVTKEKLTLVGMKHKFSRNNNIIPWLWQQFNPRRNEITNKVNDLSYGVCLNDEKVMAQDATDDTVFTEFVGIEVENTESIPDGMETLELPAATYAVFKHKGYLSELTETFNYIYGQWAPSQNKYQFADYFDFELYDPKRFQRDSLDSEIEIWVPVKVCR